MDEQFKKDTQKLVADIRELMEDYSYETLITAAVAAENGCHQMDETELMLFAIMTKQVALLTKGSDNAAFSLYDYIDAVLNTSDDTLLPQIQECAEESPFSEEKTAEGCNLIEEAAAKKRRVYNNDFSQNISAITEAKTKTFRPGVHVKMNGKYHVPKRYRDITLTVRSTPIELGGVTVVFLEEYTSCYPIDGLMLV